MPKSELLNPLPTPAEWDACLRVLQAVSDEPSLADDNERFKGLVARVNKRGRKSERIALEERRRALDSEIRLATGMVQTQTAQAETFTTPDSADDSGDIAPPTTDYLRLFEALAPVTAGEELSEPLNRWVQCYICKKHYNRLHFYYHLLCPDCARLNYAKRTQAVDLTGRIALVTGGRVKIGYQTVLRLLRDGARVVATTRFPRDAARRYARESDFADWRDRLTLCALDLRRPTDVESFADYLTDTLPHLDIVINNAAQTIKRPLEWYRTLLDGEGEPPAALAADARVLLSASPFFQSSPLLEAHPDYPVLPGGADLAAYFPPRTFDGDGQPVDARPENSWTMRLPDVPTVELLEVLLVNAVAPFVLNGRLKRGRLKRLMLRSPFQHRFIVNVSAMEGQFTRPSKTAAHPHTNMAKAASNMLTRTAAQDYAESNIYMNSVDTGWITDENPLPKRDRLRDEREFYPPLDILDGVARIYDPIAQGLNHFALPHGVFFKDYKQYPW